MTRLFSLKPLDAIAESIRGCRPLLAEEIPLDDCLGRTLAESFCAPGDLPGFRRSVVDGFAVHAGDVAAASGSAPVFLRCVGECRMGTQSGVRLRAGQTMRIWTGGMLPEGADAVVPQECVRLCADGVECLCPAVPGGNVAAADEDAREGQELIRGGSVLRPPDIGLLAAFGREKVGVRRRPKVAVISTGDEVVRLGLYPGPGQVRDVNSYTLTSLARAAGAEARAVGPVVDDREALRARIREALAFADVLIVSGGSSAGYCDRTLSMFQELPGSVILSTGMLGSGKTPIAARLGEKFLWGLPGHVAGAMFCAEICIRPLLRRLLGQPEQPGYRQGAVPVQLSAPVVSRLGRCEHIRVALEPSRTENGPLLARPIRGKPRSLSSLVQAQALIVCPEDQEGFEPGQILSAQLML